MTCRSLGALLVMAISLSGCIHPLESTEVTCRPADLPSCLLPISRSSDVFDGELRSLQVERGGSVSCEFVLRPKFAVFLCKKSINRCGCGFYFQSKKAVYHCSHKGPPIDFSVEPYRREESILCSPGDECVIPMRFSTIEGFGPQLYQFEDVEGGLRSCARLPEGQYSVYRYTTVAYFPVASNSAVQTATWLIKSAAPIEVRY